jgi:chromosome segregation ATPase
MADSNEPTNGGRVTMRDLMNAIQHQDEKREAMENRIMDKLECIPELRNQISNNRLQAEKNEKKIESIRSENRVWNGLNSFGAVIAGILGIKFGGP